LHCDISAGCQTKYGACKGNNKCGPNIGNCPEGKCCSKYGWCGTSDNHCKVEKGCQSAYGICNSSSVAENSSSNKRSDRCGTGIGSCPEGECCSKHGWCGTTTSYCSLSEGCQPGFGACIYGNTVDYIKVKNRCGDLFGRCPEGECCSKYGWCGTATSFCSLTDGCQPAFGSCIYGNTIDYINVKDKCGEGYGSCPEGQCCSKYGWCGKKDEFCSVSNGCQSKYGTCSNNSNTSTTKTTSITRTKTTTTTKKATSTSGSTSTAGIVAYLPNYRFYNTIDLKTYDFTGINVVYYCFFQVSNDGVVSSTDSKADFDMGSIKYLNHDVKKKYPGLRTVLTMGGAYISENFKYFLRNSDTLEKAAVGMVAAMKENDFDGIDIDWEMPETEEESGYLLTLVKRLRELIGDDKILSLSVHFVPSNYFGYIGKYEPYLSWFNIMSYYYSGYWNQYSGYNSPLYKPSTNLNNQRYGDKSIQDFVDEGVPLHKLVLGIPFFGQAWSVQSGSNDGYNQLGTTNVKGESGDVSNSGLWTYHALRKEKILTSTTSTDSSWKRRWHSDVKSPTLYNSSTYIFISYDDVDSMCERSTYAKEKKIAGVAVWEIGQDYKRELIGSLVQCYKN